MEFSVSCKSREIDRSEGFYRIMSIFGAAFNVTSPPFLSALVLLRSKQCLVLRKPIRWQEIIYPVLVVARTVVHPCDHPCCDQLTAAKTVYSLTSIARPYRGLRYRPTEFEYFLEIIRWQVTTFQMIAGSSSVFLKCMWNKLCSWYAPLTFDFKLTWESRTRKFNRLLNGGKLVASWSRVVHALRLIFVLWLVKIWQVSSCWKCMQHRETCFLIAEAHRVFFV